jgi:hypothetical protein
VVQATKEERALMAKAPYNEREYKEDLGVQELWGEEGYTTNERTGIRPTLEVNGIWAVIPVRVLKPYSLRKRLQKFQRAWCLTNHPKKSQTCY